MIELVATLVIFYGIVLGVGVFQFRRQTASEYITAPNTTNFVPLTLTLLGTIVGGGMFLAVSQLGFESGVTGLALGAAYLVGNLAFGLLSPALRRIARERGVTTLLGLVESLYPSSGRVGPATMLTWATFLVFFLMLAVQFVGIATFLSFFLKLEFDTTIMIVAALLAVVTIPLYTAFGGFRRDVFTDVVQMTFVAIGLVVIFLNIGVHGLESKLAELPSELTSVGTAQLVYFVAALIFIVPTFLVRFDLWQRVITARSDGQARAAFIVAGLVSFLFFSAFSIIGMFARADGATDAQFAGLETIQRSVTWGYGVAVVAFFAAVMSSADTFLGVSGLALARGTVYRSGQLEQGSASVFRLRLITAGVGVVSLALAYFMRDIIDLFASAFAVLMVFLPGMIGGLVRKEPGYRECWWSVATGLGVIVACTPFMPRQAFAPALLTSLVAYLAIMVISKIRGGINPKTAE